MNIQERLTAFAMLGASWVLWLLVILSIVGLAVVFERARFFYRTRSRREGLTGLLEEKMRAGDIEGLKKALRDDDSCEAVVLRSGIDHLDDGVDAVAQRMAGALLMVRLRMEKLLSYLGTVGNNAPFVGLLGTVIGIIRSFAELEASQGQVTSGLMAEVGEALVATAIGILVALPAVAFYNYFQRVVKGRVTQAQAYSEQLLSLMKAGATQAETAEAEE